MQTVSKNTKKKILVVGHTPVTCISFEACLLTFLGDYVEIVPWCVSDSTVPPKEAASVDLSLAVTRLAYDLCRAYSPPDKPVLVAERVLSVNKLDKLLSLEAGAKAYVVGTNHETTVNTISLLHNLGFTDNIFVPYYVGMADRVQTDITVAITPGLLQTLPPHSTTVIDIGAKEVAISTLAEIMQLLGIPITELNTISSRYIQTILGATRERSYIGFQNEALKNQLETILNTLQEAIVALDENRRVIVYNQASEKIFTVPVAKAIGSDWQEIMPDSIMVACLERGEGISRQLKFIDGQHYLVDANLLLDHGQRIQGVVASFHPVQEIKELETQVRRELKDRANVARYSFKDIKGSSAELRRAVSLATKFAATDLTILLEGESGTGKELFAQAIHNQSSRRGNPFVAINFAAIPDNLVESELFGYEEGAFTGARKGGKTGLFEEAHPGTIFLDEIGSASPDVQNRLLRVLEEREIRRLGSGRTTPVDVRVIAATNIDLEELVNQKRFRGDLYYRLCALPIVIPSLRTRKTDILGLTDYFIKKYSETLECSPEVRDVFLHYAWPGNIRELQNIVKYLCSVVDPGKTAKTDDLPPYLLRKLDSERRERTVEHAAAPPLEKLSPHLFGEFERPDTRRAVIILLSELKEYTAACRGVGYMTLLRNIRGRIPGVSEYYVKRWLKGLKDSGYVETGKTKQGSYITEKGLALLENLKETPG